MKKRNNYYFQFAPGRYFQNRGEINRSALAEMVVERGDVDMQVKSYNSILAKWIKGEDSRKRKLYMPNMEKPVRKMLVLCKYLHTKPEELFVRTQKLTDEDFDALTKEEIRKEILIDLSLSAQFKDRDFLKTIIRDEACKEILTDAYIYTILIGNKCDTEESIEEFLSGEVEFIPDELYKELTVPRRE